VRRLDVVQVVGARPQRPLDTDPGRGQMGSVQVRGPALECLAAVLLLVRPVGQAHVRLPGHLALRQRKHRSPLPDSSAPLRRLPRGASLLGPLPLALLLLALPIVRPPVLRPSPSTNSISSPLADPLLRLAPALRCACMRRRSRSGTPP